LKFLKVLSVVLIFNLLNHLDLYSQEVLNISGNLNYYAQAGVVFQFGSHQNRVGISVSAKGGRDYANLGLEYNVLYTLSDFGYYEKTFQHILGFKVTTAIDRRDHSFRSFQYSPFSSNCFYEFHYQYRYYFNHWNTAQTTGEIGLNFGHFYIYHENDLLAAKSVDKFRTAAMRLGYQDSIQSFATSFTFWTGNKDDPKTKRINESKFSRYGYFDLSDTPFGKYSHGVLAVDYIRQLPLANQIGFSLGYDHEKIRNAIQNKFMHDLPFYPKKWNTAKSRHIPMVDQEGNSYLYEEGQQLREGQFYFNIGLNTPEFY